MNSAPRPSNVGRGGKKKGKKSSLMSCGKKGRLPFSLTGSEGPQSTVSSIKNGRQKKEGENHHAGRGPPGFWQIQAAR